jgi:hypothetical protein
MPYGCSCCRLFTVATVAHDFCGVTASWHRRQCQRAEISFPEPVSMAGTAVRTTKPWKCITLHANRATSNTAVPSQDVRRPKQGIERGCDSVAPLHECRRRHPPPQGCKRDSAQHNSTERKGVQAHIQAGPVWHKDRACFSKPVHAVVLMGTIASTQCTGSPPPPELLCHTDLSHPTLCCFAGDLSAWS